MLDLFTGGERTFLYWGGKMEGGERRSSLHSAFSLSISSLSFHTALVQCGEEACKGRFG